MVLKGSVMAQSILEQGHNNNEVVLLKELLLSSWLVTCIIMLTKNQGNDYIIWLTKIFGQPDYVISHIHNRYQGHNR